MSENITPQTHFRVTLGGLVAILFAVVGGTWFVSEQVKTLGQVVLEQSRQETRLTTLEDRLRTMDERGADNNRMLKELTK